MATPDEDRFEGWYDAYWAVLYVAEILRWVIRSVHADEYKKHVPEITQEFIQAVAHPERVKPGWRPKAMPTVITKPQQRRNIRYGMDHAVRELTSCMALYAQGPKQPSMSGTPLANVRQVFGSCARYIPKKEIDRIEREYRLRDVANGQEIADAECRDAVCGALAARAYAAARDIAMAGVTANKASP